MNNSLGQVFLAIKYRVKKYILPCVAWLIYPPLLMGILVLLAPGCRVNSNHVVGEATTVVIWDFGGVPGHQAWIKKAIAAYNKAHDNTQIELEVRDWATQRESLITSTIMGEGPDIIRVHHKYAVEFGQLGGLYALENFADFPQVKEQILDNLWDHVEYDKHHYGLPFTMLPFIMPVNMAILEAHHLEIPTTWEEVWEMGPVLKKSGIHALTMPGGANLDTAYRFLALYYRAGGRLFNEAWTEAVFNGAAGLETLNFLVEMKDAGFFPAASAAYRSDENEAHWSGEQAVLAVEGPWWQSVVSDHFGFDLAKLQLAPLIRPQKLLEANGSNTLIDVVMMAITGYSKAPDQAWLVLKALVLEDPVWRTPDPAMGGLPTLKAAYLADVPSAYINMDVLAQAGANGLGWPGHPAITEIQRHIADAVNVALAGTMSPQQALDLAVVEVNEVLADY